MAVVVDGGLAGLRGEGRWSRGGRHGRGGEGDHWHPKVSTNIQPKGARLRVRLLEDTPHFR